MIKAVICKVRVEEIEDPLMRNIRYLDKLVDDLPKGKSMEKIKRIKKYCKDNNQLLKIYFFKNKNNKLNDDEGYRKEIELIRSWQDKKEIFL